MVDTNPTISIISLNVSGLNAPIKKERLPEWIKKHDPTIFCLQETHYKYKDTYILKINEWRDTT